MRRVLLVLRGSIDVAALQARSVAATDEPAELAICYELPGGHDSLQHALSAQRAVTQALREACGPLAEDIPVFAVSDRDGERVDDYAQAWGATVVWT